MIANPMNDMVLDEVAVLAKAVQRLEARSNAMAVQETLRYAFRDRWPALAVTTGEIAGTVMFRVFTGAVWSPCYPTLEEVAEWCEYVDRQIAAMGW